MGNEEVKTKFWFLHFFQKNVIKILQIFKNTVIISHIFNLVILSSTILKRRGNYDENI